MNDVFKAEDKFGRTYYVTVYMVGDETITCAQAYARARTFEESSPDVVLVTLVHRVVTPPGSDEGSGESGGARVRWMALHVTERAVAHSDPHYLEQRDIHRRVYLPMRTLHGALRGPTEGGERIACERPAVWLTHDDVAALPPSRHTAYGCDGENAGDYDVCREAHHHIHRLIRQLSYMWGVGPMLREGDSTAYSLPISLMTCKYVTDAELIDILDNHPGSARETIRFVVPYMDKPTAVRTSRVTLIGQLLDTNRLVSPDTIITQVDAIMCE